MADVVHIPNAGAALQTLGGEHQRICEALMATVDVLEEVQAGEYQLDLANLRAATANVMRDSTAKTVTALDVIGAVV